MLAVFDTHDTQSTKLQQIVDFLETRRIKHPFVLAGQLVVQHTTLVLRFG